MARRLAVMLVALLAVLLSAGTTTASAATFIYDAPAAARVGVDESASTEIGLAQVSGAQAGSAWAFALARESSAALPRPVVATQLSGSGPVPGVKRPGSGGGSRV